MTAPGWYPDQNDPSKQRYFDGTRWTDHTAVTSPLAVNQISGQAPQTPPQQATNNSRKIVLGLVAAFVAVVALSISLSHGKSTSSSTGRDRAAYEAPAMPTKPVRTGPTTAIEDDGTFVIGVDIVPGTYRTEGTTSCYWERLSGLGGSFKEIISNSSADGQQVVQIAPSDKAFKTNGCGYWQKVG